MIQDLSLDSLRAFRVFAERVNFTHAAEDLNISQPSLHVKIQELSRQVGVPLYLRQGRKLELTAKGRELALFAGELEDRLASFEQQFRDDHSHPVVLAAGQGAYLYLLGAALKCYLRQSTPLKLLTLDREGCLEAVLGGKAHLGVAPLETVPDILNSSVLAQVHSVVAMPARHRLARRSSLELADLEGSALVVPPGDRPHRQILAGALLSAGVSWTVGVEANGWELMLHFVKLGLGLAVVNSCCTIPRGLVARPLAGLPAVVYHIFGRRGYQRPEAAALRKLILESSQVGAV